MKSAQFVISKMDPVRKENLRSQFNNKVSTILANQQAELDKMQQSLRKQQLEHEVAMRISR